jgi:hypothetical protein
VQHLRSDGRGREWARATVGSVPVRAYVFVAAGELGG